MSCEVIHLAPEPEFVGRGVCAIGVFDGVHMGHQALVRRAVEIARVRRVAAYVVTFDRDPDQVVSPESAAPQLLTLADKARFLCDAGADAVLVVPFTEQISQLTPEGFLTEVLLSAVDPVAVVVGEDFCFGYRAQGTVDVLRSLCAARGIDVVAESLVQADDAPVTSTRIRELVAAGDTEGAAALLGRSHRVSGTVVYGRGEGASIGVPTANIEPVDFAALPAAGVYAGRVAVGDRTWPAAVSVGRPPTFPQATDVLEAHLIGFDGDVYGMPVSVEFIARLREQRRFGSVDELVAAIRADIEAAEKIAGPAECAVSVEEYPAKPLSDDPIIEDPAALACAEAQVAAIDSEPWDDARWEWAELVGPRRLSGMFSEAGFTAALVTAPLRASGIPFRWDPYPPELMPMGSRVLAYGAVDRPFSLYVPSERLQEAREVMGL